ncbi:hypothetical protein AGMMS49543_26910 [Betaproteobacteria bacterium]|nr:hypothetical protein AGMMS49543_26910 [Betaproteobacteria bacterium]
MVRASFFKSLKPCILAAMNAAASITLLDSGDAPRLCVGGAWTLAHYRALGERIAPLRQRVQAAAGLELDLSALTALDTAGAQLLGELIGVERLREQLTHPALSHAQRVLLATVADALVAPHPPPAPRQYGLADVFAHIGEAAIHFWQHLVTLLAFIGVTLEGLVLTLLRPWCWRVTPVVANLEQTGFDAIPIVALLKEVAARYAQNATEVDTALTALLNENPLDRFPTKRQSLPEFWLPRFWSRPVLANGKALPDEALEHLGQMFTFPTHEGLYPGLEQVKAACRPDSLADFAWDCFNAWLEAFAPAKEGWALTTLGFVGNDDTVRKLTPLIRAWPGEAAHARAVTGLTVLENIGTDVALMLLNGIAQKVKFKGLQDKAREKIAAIAEKRDLTPEELEDRLAPDLGLDEQGTLLLDFGPRRFRVGFDEALKPYVREMDGEEPDARPGARLPDLPKPKKTDDAELSKAAVERFKLLKKDARTIASQQVLRLEVAMCARRRWTPEVFAAFLAGHPLVRYLVQRLIWGVYRVGDEGADGGALQACFRVAEDGAYTTADDEPFDLPADKTLCIGVPHALEISAQDAAAFGQIFADYELLQPFAQIGRDTYTLTEAEKSALKLERWKGVTVPTGRVLGLVNKGWRRGEVLDGGGIGHFLKPLYDGNVIKLELDACIIVGMVNEYPEQTLGEVQFGKKTQRGEIRDPKAFTGLDAIAASELIRDMEGLRA